MPEISNEHEYDDTLRDIARQIGLGIKRRQVILGGDRLALHIRRQQVGMVWATIDLSRHALHKIKAVCHESHIPLLIAGTSDEVSEQTAEPRVKVYLLRKGFSGLHRIIRMINSA